MTLVPSVVFVCVHNAGRSQMPAALLDHEAHGRVEVASAGSEPAAELNPAVVAAMAEIGIDLSGEFPKPLTGDQAHADVIITMGCGDTCPSIRATAISTGTCGPRWPGHRRSAPDPGRHSHPRPPSAHRADLIPVGVRLVVAPAVARRFAAFPGLAFGLVLAVRPAPGVRRSTPARCTHGPEAVARLSHCPLGSHSARMTGSRLVHAMQLLGHRHAGIAKRVDIAAIYAARRRRGQRPGPVLHQAAGQPLGRRPDGA